MTRVLVTRPEPGATRTLDTLLQLGFDAVSISFSEILPLNAKMPGGDFDALIITSQNAIVHADDLRHRFLAKQVYAVGERTAEQLQLLGHQNVVWSENAQMLVGKLIKAAPKRSLYLCGKTRKPDLEAGLAGVNLPFVSLEVYETVHLAGAAAKLEPLVTDPLATVVMFHAQSAVDGFAMAMKHRPLPKEFQFLCMSAAIAAQLPVTWPHLITIAEQPNEASMLHLLHKLLY